MVVIRWTLNLLVVAGMALVMRHATESHLIGHRVPDGKSGFLRAAAFRF